MLELHSCTFLLSKIYVQLFGPAPGPALGCSSGVQLCPCRAGHAQRIQTARSLLLFPTPLQPEHPSFVAGWAAIPAFQLEKEVATSCPPAARDAQRAAMLPARDEHSTETAPCPFL